MLSTDLHPMVKAQIEIEEVRLMCESHVCVKDIRYASPGCPSSIQETVKLCHTLLSSGRGVRPRTLFDRVQGRWYGLVSHNIFNQYHKPTQSSIMPRVSKEEKAALFQHVK